MTLHSAARGLEKLRHKGRQRSHLDLTPRAAKQRAANTQLGRHAPVPSALRLQLRRVAQ